ncbi:MAG TPA: PEPxxWA-CTERM sorting domain-containing protein [Sphingomonas sp.]|jgi:hypothetical protein|nr:PEPxxWA-CTERM sorting domain-containing protein [Sphingomonas sp.]
MRVLLLALVLAALPAPARAAVTYTLSIKTDLFGGFDGSASVELPRYLVQPDPPAFRQYEFEPGSNVACQVNGIADCTRVFLAAVPSFTGEYWVTGDIATPLITQGVIFKTARLDTNGTYFGSFQDGRITGVLTISGAPTYVPEPASWAMLIAGFGLLGAAQRRSRSGRPLIGRRVQHVTDR